MFNHLPYFLEGHRVSKCVKVFFTEDGYCEEVGYDIFPLEFELLCLGDNWFPHHRVINE